MHSIRTKITLMTCVAIVVSILCATVLSVVAIRNLGTASSERILSLLCESGARNLNAQFESVEQSVETVALYAQSDLAVTDLSRLDDHLARVRAVFEKTAAITPDIRTYYYRIDPEIPTEEQGFWYVHQEGAGFREHAVTDITRYDTDDRSALVWFTVPKATGKAVWLPPYVTETLGAYVMSYNVPIYKDGHFLGVIGIEIDYRCFVEPVDAITLYDNGYAFVNDADGYIIYHPHMSLEELTGGNQPKVPEGLLSDSSSIRYRYNGVQKQAVWLPLHNGMRLNVTVPVSEISGDWQRLIRWTVAVSAGLLLVFIILTLHVANTITKPLRKLTEAAKQLDAGNYDIALEPGRNDEVGQLTRSFSQLVQHMKIYIGDLNSRLYVDALTSVRNKGAFDRYVADLQEKLGGPEDPGPFAVGVFDCDDLKAVNDNFGHDKGDLYLKAASSLICHVYRHSPVFRIGGDEFAVVLMGEDYAARAELARAFGEQCAATAGPDAAPWQRVSVSAGFARYDPALDGTVSDTVRRADHEMYENKISRKAGRDAVIPLFAGSGAKTDGTIDFGAAAKLADEALDDVAAGTGGVSPAASGRGDPGAPQL